MAIKNVRKAMKKRFTNKQRQFGKTEMKDTQDYILEHYSDLIDQYKQSYCCICLFRDPENEGECKNNLLPVTIHGQPCIYFRSN